MGGRQYVWVVEEIDSDDIPRGSLSVHRTRKGAERAARAEKYDMNTRYSVDRTSGSTIWMTMAPYCHTLTVRRQHIET